MRRTRNDVIVSHFPHFSFSVSSTISYLITTIIDSVHASNDRLNAWASHD